MDTKRRGGQPKPPQLRRDARLVVRLTHDERDRIEQAAIRAGIPASTWLRMLGLREADKGGE